MNQSLQNMTMHLPIGNLDAYVARVNQIPMLTAEEETDLGERFFEQQDLAAARQLVLAHLRFVVRVARGYSGYGLSQADLIQEGNIGLMKAVKRFNPHMGVRLVSFAVHWIKAEIHEFILRNWRIVKIATTKAQRKLFFNLRHFKKRLGWFSEEEIHGVAQDLGVSTREVRTMEERLNAHDMALEGPLDTDEEQHAAPIAYLESPHSDPAEIITAHDWAGQYQDKLHHALTTLDERSRDILEQRWLAKEKATLHQLAAKYQVSAERVRQLEQNAITRLKSAII